MIIGFEDKYASLVLLDEQYVENQTEHDYVQGLCCKISDLSDLGSK